MFHTNLLFTFILFFISSINGDPVCPNGTVLSPTNNMCYNFVNAPATFSESESFCASLGGHLAAVDSGFVNTFLSTHASSFSLSEFWIGLNLYGNSSCKPWIWTDRNQLALFTDWASGEPSSKGNCASMKVSDGTWIAIDCYSMKPYVCAIPPAISYCPSEWMYFANTDACYKVFFKATWQDAEVFCTTQNAHLVSIHSDAENAFVNFIAQSGHTVSYGDNSDETWIGFYTTYDDNTNYQWSDGSPVNYLDWAPGQPDEPGLEKCTVLYADKMDNVNQDGINHFNNINCDFTVRNYICKQPAKSLSVR